MAHRPIDEKRLDFLSGFLDVCSGGDQNWIEGLVQVLANELRGRNITVNAVAPSPVATELLLGGKTKEQIVQFSFR